MRDELDRRQYRSTAELLIAIRHRHLITQSELAERSGVARPQLARYESGSVEPSVATLRRLLDGLGWKLTFGLEPTTAVLDAQLARPYDLAKLLGFDVRRTVELAALAAADGLDVVVGGDAAAVLQGVPAATRHAVLHLRADHLRRFATAAAARLASVVETRDSDDVFELYLGDGVFAVLLVDVLPPTRHVRPDLESWPEGLAAPVVDLATLLTSESALSATALALAHRMGDLRVSESIPRSVL